MRRPSRTSHDGLPHAAAVAKVGAQLRVKAGPLRRPLIHAVHWAALLQHTDAQAFGAAQALASILKRVRPG